MRIAICASEGAPYAKSGGLGDVMEALPAALQRIEGNEVVLFLPFYNKIKELRNKPRMCVATQTVWALPRSLATTGGIISLFSLPGGTEMFQFPPFASLPCGKDN